MTHDTSQPASNPSAATDVEQVRRRLERGLTGAAIWSPTARGVVLKRGRARVRDPLCVAVLDVVADLHERGEADPTTVLVRTVTTTGYGASAVYGLVRCAPVPCSEAVVWAQADALVHLDRAEVLAGQPAGAADG